MADTKLMFIFAIVFNLCGILIQIGFEKYWLCSFHIILIAFLIWDYVMFIKKIKNLYEMHNKEIERIKKIT